MHLKAYVRFVPWLLIANVAVMTLSPIEARPVTGYSADLERFAAFSALGVLFILAYPKHKILMLVLLIAASGLLEYAQHLDASRHGQFHDFLVKAAGAVLGAAVASLLNWGRWQMRPAQSSPSG